MSNFHKLPRSLTLRLTPALIYSFLFSCVSMTVAVIGGNFPLDIMCLLFSSGEWESLWFREAERNADQGQHGGPARADSHSPLWAIPPVQAGGDGIQRHRPWLQTLQVKSHNHTEWSGKISPPQPMTRRSIVCVYRHGKCNSKRDSSLIYAPSCHSKPIRLWFVFKTN